MDTKTSYSYSSAMSSLEILRIGNERLVSFISYSLNQNDSELKERLDRVIYGQCEILSIDYLIMNKKLLDIYKILSTLIYTKIDHQNIHVLESRIERAENRIKEIRSVEDLQNDND